MVAFFDEPIQTIRGTSVGAALAPGFEVSIAKNPLDKTITNWPTAVVNPAYDGTGPMLGKAGTNSMYHITDPSAVAANQAAANERKINTEADQAALTEELVRKKLGQGGGAPDPVEMAKKLYGTPGPAPTGAAASAPMPDGGFEIPGVPNVMDFAISPNAEVQQQQQQQRVPQYQEPARMKAATPPLLDQGDATDAGPRNLLGGLLDDDGTFKYSLNKLLKKE